MHSGKSASIPKSVIQTIRSHDSKLLLDLRPAHLRDRPVRERPAACGRPERHAARAPQPHRECAIAFVLFLVFMFVGKHFLEALHLRPIALGIGGAVILLMIAIRKIFPLPDGVLGESEGGKPFIVPLAILALAGSSALATVLLLWRPTSPKRWSTWPHWRRSVPSGWLWSSAPRNCSKRLGRES
jgi:hypothetical protein